MQTNLRGGVAPSLFFAEAGVDAGQEVPLRGDALTNRSGDPIEIHEIRFSAYTATQTVFAGVDCGAFTRVKIECGDRKITNGYVPFWLLGRTEQLPVHWPAAVFGPGTNIEARGIYIWRLSAPWYLSPKYPLSVSFQHAGGIRNSVQAQIALAGRVVDKRPTTTTVPYAAAYVSKSFGYSTTDYDESTESDLVNSLPRAVNIDHIIGRVSMTSSASQGQPARLSDYGGVGAINATQLRLSSSRGVPLIRDYTTFRGAFGYSRSIDVPFKLDPGDYLHAHVKNVPGPALLTPLVTYYAQAHLGIIGSREEAI